MPRIALLIVFVLVACIGCAGGPPKRVFPPAASVQELRLDPNGQWIARLRIESFSTVPMTLARVDGSLVLGDTAPVAIALTPTIDVAAGSVELLDLAFTPSAELRAAVQQVQERRGSLRYSLKGEIRSSEPRGRFDYDYSSALSPVPGLGDVLR